MKNAIIYYSVRCNPFYHHFTDLNTAEVMFASDCLSVVQKIKSEQGSI